MSYRKMMVVTAAFSLLIVLTWGCQNSKPVGPMKYVTLNANVSTKGLVAPNRLVGGMELMYRVTGPSMNPVSGKVTVGFSEPALANASAAAVDMVETGAVNFTAAIPAGPSRTLAVQLNYIPVALEDRLANPGDVRSIGAVRFDIDPGTAVVNVPVELGNMCFDCCWQLGGCFNSKGGVAYMGNTDLVNCAFVPNDNAFFTSSCDAKMYFNNGNSGPVDTVSLGVMSDAGLETGDVFCERYPDGGHRWIQIGRYTEIYYRYNSSLPYYAFDPNFLCYAE